jgi:hypothetical protein
MTDCADEHHTCHYRGRWLGFGPVRNSEHVLFAVFDRTRRDNTRLAANSFDNTSLANNTQSLSRASYVRRPIFDHKIVQPGRSSKGELVGIACAEVSEIRQLYADFADGRATRRVRALCVLDQVDSGDADGHATTGYKEATVPGIGQTYLGKVRAKIRLDLANTFSEIVHSNDHAWPPHYVMPFKRLVAILRALFTVLSGH